MTDMSPSIALVVTIGVLVAAGVYLVLERSLTRIIVGLVLIGNGVNLLLADGSNRFVTNGINLFTWRALGTRNGYRRSLA